jgi:hypothetical protein
MSRTCRHNSESVQPRGRTPDESHLEVAMRHRDDTRALAELAARQNGNVTHRQLVDAGLSPQQIKRRREAGWLVPRHTGVYAVGYVPAARESAWHAAVLALGAGAVLGYASA